jgi:D-3-phosphoglycerate dehydrogenase
MHVLFVDTVHEELEKQLVSNGFTSQHYLGKSKEELIPLLKNADGIVIRSKVRIDEDLLSCASRLKFIARAGAGMENIDLQAAEKRGIICFNSPEGNRDAVAEQAIGMLLMLMCNIKRADQEVRKGIWKRAENRGEEIMGKTIGIIGYGNTGQAFAKKLSGFDANILVYDKYKSGFTDSYIDEVGIETIYKETDILSLHIPLSDETLYMVNDNFISSFNKPFYFINTSRGKNVYTPSLVRALQTGKIKGACIDVLEYESVSFETINQSTLPDDFKYLIESDKVILTPHIAGWTHESNIKMSKVLAQKILEWKSSIKK